MRTIRTIAICQWPELELHLFTLFLESRGKGQGIHQAWFKIHGYDIFKRLYLQSNPAVFRFSNGWFQGFLNRYRIGIRCITKKTQKLPSDYQDLIVNWLRFNRCNSQPQPDDPCPNTWLETVLCQAVGRYHLKHHYLLNILVARPIIW